MTRRYLLDTCVVSEFVKPQPEKKVLGWLNSVDADQVFLSVVTLGELQFGISNLPASNRRTELEAWLDDELKKQFTDRVLPLDADTFIVWGQMTAQQGRQGQPMGVMDSLIAATALQYRMILVTRNIADFAATELSLFNPWE